MINDLLSYGACPHCAGTRLCIAESEVCCSSCGAVLGNDYQLQEAPSGSKLNLYQATEVGTKKVNLDCARHIHENNSDISQLSNVCVKLDLPIYAAQDANAVYQKILRQKQKERQEHAEKLKKLSTLAQKDLKQEENLADLKRERPKGCTRAHIATFAVHLVCRKYGLPRSDKQILEAVRMNFGVKRTFTILKSYSLNEITAQELGIECNHDKASYYVRLMLSRLQDAIGTGQLYDTIERQAFANLQKISDRREDVRAHRALDLAVRGARLYVQI